jgi:MFS family permease
VVDKDVGGVFAWLKTPVAVFRSPDLRRVQLAWAAMSFATWAYAIGLGVYAFEIGGAAGVGVVALLRLLPGALAAPFAGLLGDSYSRRRVLIASAAATALVLGVSAVTAGAGGAPAVVFVAASAFALVTAAYQPVQAAILPLLSRTPQELSAANVVLSAMDNVGFVGGALGSGVLLAISGPEAVFALAAVLAALAAVLLFCVAPDERPGYVEEPEPGRVVRQTLSGASTILAVPGLRLLVATLTSLSFFEGMVDVLVVVAALQLLDLGEASVGYLNAAWGIGALGAGGATAMLLHRGQLAIGIGSGALIIGGAGVLIAAWSAPLVAYVVWILFGAGFTLVEVAGKTFLQRLASDEVMARVFASQETLRLTAAALGSIAAPLLVAAFGVEGALLAAAAVMPLFAAARWAALKAFETGMPVDRGRYALLRGNEIFQPLPVATLQRVCQDMVSLEVEDGTEVITQGDRGDRFYLVAAGEVAVFKGGVLCATGGAGESFGEIALVRDVPRTATVRASCQTSLLALGRDQFISAVTGYPRSRQLTEDLIDSRLGSGSP